jgi:hypothetical protein
MTDAVTSFRREPSETPVEAVRRLEAEARDIAHSATQKLFTDLVLITGRCADVSSLESVPVGVREVLRRLGESIAAEVEKAQAVQARDGRP